jgi:hypothetical protein
MSGVTMEQPAHAGPITAAECWSWLAARTEGRLGYRSGRGPRWVVVSYRVARDGTILIQIPEFNEIGQYAPGAQVTLEVDGVTGPGERQTLRVQGRADLRTGPTPAGSAGGWSERWPPGVHASIVVLHIDEVQNHAHAERASDVGGPVP